MADRVSCVAGKACLFALDVAIFGLVAREVMKFVLATFEKVSNPLDSLYTDCQADKEQENHHAGHHYASNALLAQS